VFKKWVNWRVGLVAIVIVLAAVAFAPCSTVHEIHNSDQPFNFALVDPRPRVDDWPWWRGTAARNVASVEMFPTQWPLSENDGWQIAVAGSGIATPCLWGDQLFLLNSDTAAQRVSLLGFSRATGRPTWQAELHQGGFPAVHEKNSHAAASPACDGQYVYAAAVAHGSLWLTAIDLTGVVVWQRPAGPYWSTWGYRSSPTIYKSLVIVAADQKSGSYLTAFHRQTGEIIWRVKRPNGESFGTPVVATVAGRAQLVLGGRGNVTSYDPANGTELWSCGTSAERFASTVTFDAEHVFATSKHPQPEVLCIRADGMGDVTRTHVAWRQSKIAGEFPSPVQHAGLLYILADDGRLSCVEASTGKIEWRMRLEGSFSASPVVAAEYVICSNEAGVTYVIQAGLSSVIVAKNTLPAGIMASPVIVGDSVYVRTLSGLHRITAASTQPMVERPNPAKRRL
jgi:outer membrane protein assembly factor BamB